MADIRAAQSGDFSATTTWIGGVVPGSGDVAYANSFTVTISDTRTVQAISNASGTSITVGGTFSLLNGCNLTCTNANGVVQGNTATSCIATPNLGVGASANVSANFTHTSTTALSSTVALTTAGILNWNGNVIGATSATSTNAILISGNGALNLVGNITGGGVATTNSAVTVSAASATVSVTGNVTGLNGPAITLSSTSSIAVTGNVTGGTQSPGINSSGSGTLTVNGTCQSSSTQPAIGAGSAAQITRLSGPFLLGATGNINPVQCQSWRWAPTLVPTYLEVATSGGSTKRILYSADFMPSGGYPTAGNVRQSTVYGPSSEFTGTLAVPAASSVALGVAVDNTTGTAILTAANVRTAMGLASANLDTQLAAIPTTAAPSAAANASAVWSAATRTLTATIPDAASIASAVWSAATRTLTSSFPTVPTAAEVASAVWAAATRTITTSIPTAAEVASAVWSAVTRTITGGTVDTLTNSPNVPSAATIAAAVWAAADKTGYSLTSAERQAIATAVEQSILNENDGQAILNAIVGAIGNTNVDQVALVAAIRADLERSGGTLATRSTLSAAGVRAELAPELARVANCATVDTVATTVQDATSAN